MHIQMQLIVFEEISLHVNLKKMYFFDIHKHILNFIHTFYLDYYELTDELKKDWKINSCIEKIVKQVNHLIFATELNDVNRTIFQYYGNLVHYDDPSIQISCKITFTQKRRKKIKYSLDLCLALM